MVKERPILFSAPMVRALLNDTKTQTRRILKSQPHESCGRITVENYNPVIVDRFGDEQPGAEIFGAYSDDGEWGSKCPYGQPGDFLWVRETWAAHWMYDDVPPSAIPSDGESLIHYPADGYVTEHAMGADHFRKLRPSIHMPRWVSRITLRISNVTVERLKNISEKDATAEGTPHSLNLPAGRTAVDNYAHLWDCINGDGSWELNPWVWVVEFKRV